MLSRDLLQILQPKMPFFVRQKKQIPSKILPQIPNFGNFVKNQHFRHDSQFSAFRQVFVKNEVLWSLIISNSGSHPYLYRTWRRIPAAVCQHPAVTLSHCGPVSLRTATVDWHTALPTDALSHRTDVDSHHLCRWDACQRLASVGLLPPMHHIQPHHHHHHQHQQQPQQQQQQQQQCQCLVAVVLLNFQFQCRSHLHLYHRFNLLLRLVLI